MVLVQRKELLCLMVSVIDSHEVCQSDLTFSSSYNFDWLAFCPPSHSPVVEARSGEKSIKLEKNIEKVNIVWSVPAFHNLFGSLKPYSCTKGSGENTVQYRT